MDGEDPNNALDAYADRLPDAMDEKMRIGRYRYGDAWLDKDPDYMFRRMEEELHELRQAVEHDRDASAALGELADVANFGLMFVVLGLHDDATGGDDR